MTVSEGALQGEEVVAGVYPTMGLEQVLSRLWTQRPLISQFRPTCRPFWVYHNCPRQSISARTFLRKNSQSKGF